MQPLLFVTESYPPHTSGIFQRMVRGAVSHGHAVVVLTTASGATPEIEREWDAAEPYVVIRSKRWRKYAKLGESGSRIGRLASLFLSVWQMYRLKEAEAIIVEGILTTGSAAAAVKRLRKTPIIFVPIGDEVAVAARIPARRRTMHAALMEADAITCSCKQNAWEISEIAPEVKGRIVVIPPQAELPSLEEVCERPDTWTELLSRYGKRYLLTVGRLLPRKGIDTTLKALAVLAPEFPDLAYVVAGDGPYKPHLESLAKELNLTGRVMFTGAIADIDFLYHACDVYIMPNRTMPNGEREDDGTPFLLAGLAAKPVIGGQGGGAVEYVVDGVTGILADAGEPMSIVFAVRKLLTEPELSAQMGQAGRERAKRLASAQAVQEQFERMVQKVLEVSKR